MDLTAILERMESINRRIEHAVHSPDKNLQVLILGLRQDFASQCGDFLKALSDDPRTVGDRALFEELQDMFDAMRTKLAVHQRRWQTNEIGQDYASYQSASRRVYEAVSSFTCEAREKLDACGCEGDSPNMLSGEKEGRDEENFESSIRVPHTITGPGDPSN